MNQSAHTQRFSNTEKTIHWDDASPLQRSIANDSGTVRIRHGRFTQGTSDQVEVVEIDTGRMRLLVLPTRGMSIWSIQMADTRFGWQSPVPGPVHPNYVPVLDPTGLGWLEGFDELLVRCGLESNGAPEHNQQGQLVYPLHGRIGNLPAESVRIECDQATGNLDLIGEVVESKLFFKRLRLVTRLRVSAGGVKVELRDEIINELDQPATAQLLYHINLGSPLLSDGATLEAPIAELAGKDYLAASEIDTWNRYGKPQVGYAERVYFARLQGDKAGQSTAMLCAADRSRGLGVTIDTTTLPYFVVWKNTASENDGYVTGLEPATNLPNPRTFETEQGRVVRLAGGESATFHLTLQPLADLASVEQLAQQIDALSAAAPKIHHEPKSGWSPLD